MSSEVQDTFHIPFLPSTRTEDYFVGRCNAPVMNWLEATSKWTYPATILIGPKASGKSHLGGIWCEKVNGVSITPSLLQSESLREHIGQTKHFFIDGIEAILSPTHAELGQGLSSRLAVEKALFSLFSIAFDIKGRILITARTYPLSWHVGLADLKSRLLAAALIALERPDEEMLAALLVKHFSDRQLFVPIAVIDYLVNRIERSYAAPLLIVDELDKASLQKQKKLTLPFVRSILENAQMNLWEET